MNYLEKYKQVRRSTLNLCEPLSIEDYIPQIVEFASPVKWHIAHTTWFFEEMILKRKVPDYIEYDEKFSFLFNSYYNSIGERTIRTNRGNITRPTVEGVIDYRKSVDEEMCKLLQGEIDAELEQVLLVGLNHEEQHQELLITDLKYLFGQNPTFPTYDLNYNLVGGKEEHQEWIKIKEGLYEIGHQGSGFCFDNELTRHKVYMNDFEISSSLVRNQDFIEFIEAGGYKNFKFWLDDGWSWVNDNATESPMYWHKIDKKWYYYTLAGLLPVDPDAILSHISFYEASAFANWKEMRLPTEFEWEIASHQFNWGERWEWTNSAYLPYPGFRISEGALGEYNGKFMINQMVLRGGSVATPQDHSRHTYRNFFSPTTQWQFSGIRLIKQI